MPEERDRHEQPLSKAERRARLVGPARDHDEEDIAYWREATDETRGRALYDLLLLVHAIGHCPADNEVFPGFPKRRRHPA
jgi:hypothetical protein